MLETETIHEGLVVNNLSKSYKKKVIIRNISLNLKKGEAVGLLGPNGAGKTTCFYCIVGIAQPNKGEILLNDHNITNLPVYRRAKKGLGYLPQEASIFRSLTVEENILAILQASEKNAEKRQEKLEKLLSEFSIENIRNSKGIELSGGERRRAEIARSLAADPKFILLDEPFAGVDPVAVNEIRNLVSHLKERGIGVLITDHNVRETLGITDRAYVLHDGIMLAEGTPEQIISNEAVRRVYLGEGFKM
jgi:lipopolysaccharide export system ATP-binding protein